MNDADTGEQDVVLLADSSNQPSHSGRQRRVTTWVRADRATFPCCAAKSSRGNAARLRAKHSAIMLAQLFQQGRGSSRYRQTEFFEAGWLCVADLSDCRLSPT